MKKLICFLFVFCSSYGIYSQENTSATDSTSTAAEPDAALAAQNPLANIISMPLQNNTSFGYGDYDKTGNTLNIQPILPFSLGTKGLTMINRFIVPLPTTVPDLSSENASSTTGLGDINYTVWLSPAPKGKLTYGFGAVTIWPTNSDDALGSDKFSVGPSAVLVYTPGKYLLAAVISQWWSAGGDPDAADVSAFYFQPIFTYFLQKKWYLSSAPILTANWTAPEGEKWLVPIGGGGGKMFSIGKLPMDFSMQAFYYVSKPDWGPEWQLRTQLKFIFPKGKK